MNKLLKYFTSYEPVRGVKNDKQLSREQESAAAELDDALVGLELTLAKPLKKKRSATHGHRSTRPIPDT